MTVVAEASDGAEAIALAEETRPHVVVMDMRMPNVDGIEATEQIAPADWARPCVGVAGVVLIRLGRAADDRGSARRRRHQLPEEGRRPRRADRGDPRRRPHVEHYAARDTRYSAAASTTARNSAAPSAGSSSGCHSTPTANGWSASSSPSTTPSAARAETVRPTPIRSGAWWWHECAPGASGRIDHSRVPGSISTGCCANVPGAAL